MTQLYPPLDVLREPAEPIRESDILRHIFERVVIAAMGMGLESRARVP